MPHGLLWSSRAFAPVALTLVLTACGGDGGDGKETQVCRPALASAQGIPGTTIALQGLPTSPTDPTATVSADGVTVAAVIRRGAASGPHQLIVPLHPAGADATGAVTLTVTANGVACPAVGFTIGALPAAPGTARATAQAVQSALVTAATASGLTAEQLRGDATAVPPTLRGLQVLQRILDHPGNPNSLAAILAGTAPILGGRTVDVELLDRLMASTGLRAAVDAYAAAIADAGATTNALVDDTAYAVLPKPAAPGEIETGAGLKVWMDRQRAAEQRTGEAAQRLLLAFELMMGIVATKGPVGLGAAVASTVTVMSLYVYEAYQKGNLPSSVGEMSVEALPSDFPEDWTSGGRWKATVTARSKGVVLEMATVISTVADKVAPKKILEEIATRVPGAKEYLEDMWKSVASGLAWLFKVPGEKVVEDPRAWPGIDISARDFTQRTVSRTGIIQLSPTLWTDFQTVMPGETMLTIRTLPVLGEPAQERTVPITVRQIAVKVTAERLQMRPRSEQQLMVALSGALDMEVDWVPSCGEIKKEPGAFVTFVAPAMPTTCTVTATHRTKRERSGSVQIQIADVVTVAVSPLAPTLKPGEQQQFTATVEGTDNGAVTWTASGGATISEQGLFVAPQQTGKYTVVATSVADQTKTGTAMVTVVGRAIAYEVVEVKVPQTGGFDSVPVALNNRGQVVVGRHVWENGQSQDILDAFPLIGVMEVSPSAINERGEVTGHAETRFNCGGKRMMWGFRWYQGKGTTLDGTHPSSRSSGACGDTFIQGINATGRLVGTYQPRSGFGSGTIFTNDAGRDTIAPAFCGTSSLHFDQVRVAGLSDAGHYTGLNRDPATMLSRPFHCDAPGAEWDYANDEDQYTTVPDGFVPRQVQPDGRVLGTKGETPAIWTPGRGIVQLVLPPVDAASATAVNSAGEVVGMYAKGSASTPYLYKNGAAHDLNLMIPAEWTFQNPMDVNDDGWILGSAFRNGTYVPAVVLKPLR